MTEFETAIQKTEESQKENDLTHFSMQVGNLRARVAKRKREIAELEKIEKDMIAKVGKLTHLDRTSVSELQTEFQTLLNDYSA